MASLLVLGKLQSIFKISVLSSFNFDNGGVQTINFGISEFLSNREREREREEIQVDFINQQYWSTCSQMSTANGTKLSAQDVGQHQQQLMFNNISWTLIARIMWILPKIDSWSIVYAVLHVHIVQCRADGRDWLGRTKRMKILYWVSFRQAWTSVF